MDLNHIPFEELPITNRFMFALVFSHKHIAKPFLEAILGIKIFDLQEPEPEKSTETSPFNKGVRYDVFVKEQGPDGEIMRTFDIEMQIEDTHELPKRARYYQALCDSEALNKGESYRNLKEQYIIFICPDDIFKQGRAVYRFKNLEKGHPEHELGDLCYKNFLYSISTGMSPSSRSRSISNTLRPTRQHPMEQRISNFSGNGICRTTKRGSAI